MIIKTLLLIAMIGLLVWLLRARTLHRQAWSKIGILLLFIVAASAVLAPDAVNAIARAVDVGRGADLLLYCLTLAFLGASIGNYLHHQDDARHLAKIARNVALTQASADKRNQQIIRALRQKAKSERVERGKLLSHRAIPDPR